MLKLANVQALKDAVGTTVHTEEPFEVTQKLVDVFAEATKDFQWIHVDPERAAKESPFGGPIAHGFYSLSLISNFIESSIQIESGKMGVNYGLNKVRFPAPVPVGAKLHCATLIKAVEDQPTAGYKITWECTVTYEGGKKPVCVAEFLTLLFE